MKSQKIQGMSNEALLIGLPLLVIFFSLSSIVFINVADVRAVSKELQARNQVL